MGVIRMESSKRFADHMMQLRIKDVADAGLDTGSGTVPIADTQPGYTFNAWIDGHGDYLIITVRTGWGDVQQGVALTVTPCHFGGSRIWFVCPDCRRRCGVLYVGQSIACRKCHDLTYASQYEAPRERMRRQLLNIRKVIGAGMELGNPFNPPPAGMSKQHWLELIEEYKILRDKYYRECERPKMWRNEAPKAAHWKLGTRVPSSRM
ncbi:hypothetical protein ACS0VU_15095 [Aliiroseovarius sp. KMU-71]|uniref:hypothetical protein n=1 Tax=Aliiroseovarius sp. KMU-71 TaxID=3453123 RepID=UPI003F477FDC